VFIFTGDTQLSVLDSVKFDELLHVVKVDYPSDDGVADFLAVNPYKLDVLPNFIYLSNDGLNPLNVTVGNVTNLIITSNELQVL